MGLTINFGISTTPPINLVCTTPLMSFGASWGTNNTWLRNLVLLLCIVTEPILCIAQEPTTKIQPADTITKVAILPQTTTIATGSASLDAPIIYPDPRPTHVKLGLIAREYRACPKEKKAVKVANDDKPIVAEEPQEKQ
jgi:hypothetical protein